MRRFILTALAMVVSWSARAQTDELGQIPDGRAVIAVVAPADPDASISITDNGAFADYIALRPDKPVFKTYSVNPGVYNLFVGNASEPISLNLSPGSVGVVGYDPDAAKLYSEKFDDKTLALEKFGQANWLWLGQETIHPIQNKIYLSSKPLGGTDDGGPSAPQEPAK